MKTQSDERYLGALQQSGLLTKEQLARAQEDFKKQLKPLAEFLVDSTLLTPWQNEMLLEGRKGFFLSKSKYKLLARIGTRPVFLAEDSVGHRRVAIKIPFVKEDSAYLKRLYLQTQAVAALNHPNIARVFDVDNEDRIHFVVMEYVEGLDLGSIVTAVGPLPVRIAAEFVRQAADALAYSHERKLIHGDIKPGNLLRDKSDGIKVLNMGLAGILSELPLTLCEPVYEVDYLSPEQGLDAHPVDLRTDIYSLGCTLYFLLTGHAPYPEIIPSRWAFTMMKHRTDEPKPIVEARPDVSLGLVEICGKMMAKKPEDRYQTCGDVQEALADWLQNHSCG